MEFDYFPDSGFGATISPTVVSSNGQFATSFTFPLALDPGALFHVQMNYAATIRPSRRRCSEMVRLTAASNLVTVPQSFTDFLLDSVAISSYSDRGADGSILAHGRIDNLSVHTPDPPVIRVELQRDGQGWSIVFTGQIGWSYVLERTLDWQGWQPSE